jgi:hypothetical protein
MALSEFVLTEFYLLLRNPVVLEQTLSAPEAVAVVQSYRQHPRWKTVGFPPTSREIHADLWQHAATPGLDRRRIDDPASSSACAPSASPNLPPPTARTTKAWALPNSGIPWLSESRLAAPCPLRQRPLAATDAA